MERARANLDQIEHDEDGDGGGLLVGWWSHRTYGNVNDILAMTIMMIMMMMGVMMILFYD